MKYVRPLEMLAEAHGHVLLVKSGDAATSSQCHQLTAELGLPMPSSLQSFLEINDGLELRFSRRRDVETRGNPMTRYMLKIYGLKEILRSTLGLRDALSGMDLSEIDPNARATRCVSFASVIAYSSDSVVYLVPENETQTPPILHVDLEEMNWVSTAAGASSAAQIAETFEEFVTNAIEYMLRTERGFWYWIKPANVPDFW